MALNGKRILLTGASSGVGWIAAKKLAKAGAMLAISARRADRLTELAAEIVSEGGFAPYVLPADLSQRGEAATLAQAAMEALGGVDILINNAGSTMQGLTWVAGDRNEARAQFETNVWSPVALIAGLVPAMIERREGIIINIGSMARVSAFPHLGHYAASRAAGAALSGMMALELRPYGVRVVELDFGAISTAASEEVRQITGVEYWLDGPAGLGSAAKAADAIIHAVNASQSGFSFYPRALKWIDRFPALGRRFTRRIAKHADLTSTVIRYGNVNVQSSNAVQVARELQKSNSSR